MDNYERIYYCFCGDNCKFETMTKEQIIAAIAEATGNTPTNIDSAFITKVKEQNKGNALAFWIGTTAEYNALETKDDLCFYIKTDDTTLDDTNKAIEIINKNLAALEAETPNFKRLLTKEDDLNGIVEAGVYYASTASLPKNFPYTNAAVIEVVTAGSERTRIIQRATRYGMEGATTFRTLYEGTWNEWTEVVTNSKLEDSVETIKAETMLTTEIRTSGTDLNDYTTPGSYFFSGDYKPTNIPTGSNGWLLVLANGSRTMVKQIWFRAGSMNSTDHQTYIRTYINGSGWSNWHAVSVTQ